MSSTHHHTTAPGQPHVHHDTHQHIRAPRSVLASSAGLRLAAAAAATAVLWLTIGWALA